MDLKGRRGRKTGEEEGVKGEPAQTAANWKMQNYQTDREGRLGGCLSAMRCSGGTLAEERWMFRVLSSVRNST